MGCSNRAADARAEHRYCGQSLVSRRRLHRLIGDFMEVLDLVEFGGEVVLWFIEITPLP